MFKKNYLVKSYSCDRLFLLVVNTTASIAALLFMDNMVIPILSMLFMLISIYIMVRAVDNVINENLIGLVITLMFTAIFLMIINSDKSVMAYSLMIIANIAMSITTSEKE